MALEMVLWENLLDRIMEINENPLIPLDVELNKLEESLRKVKGALIGVEAGESTESNDAGSIRRKLQNLVNLLYEADDLVDNIRTTDGQREIAAVGAFGSLTKEVRSFLKPRNLLVLSGIVNGNVQTISEKFEKIANELAHMFRSNDIPIGLVENDSEPVEIEVTGRKKEKTKIMDMVLSPHPKSETNVSVIPIFGEPGIGKSTLARLVYEDEMVKTHFDLRMWIQVSHILKEEEAIKEILEICTARKSSYREHSIQTKINPSKPHKIGVPFLDLFGCQSSKECMVTEESYDGNNKIDILEGRLGKEIEGKLYLLVLDDACFKQWVRLKAILAVGAAGSRILVTTRSRKVAYLAKLETDMMFKLKGLSQKASWSLIKKLALREVDSRDSEFKEMGKSIGQCCKGEPHSLMVAGSFLYGKTKKRWLSFKNDLDHIKKREEVLIKKKSEEVMNHILEHSYNDLSIRIKACFGYCSLFPQDFEFSQNDLISLWMAQGFVDSQQEGRSYFLELSRRNFFQDVILDELRNIVSCKMHPLMYRLGRKKVAGIFNMYLVDTNMNNALDSTCKHFSVSCSADSSIQIPPSLFEAQSLRTFMSLKEPDCDAKVDRVVCNMLISKFKSLRVLGLQNLGIGVLSESIGSLVHLRYLDVSKNDIETLPTSITGLYKLHTLKLNFCHKLKFLFGNFSQLVNLKRFELHECSSLTSMPLGIEKLTQLEMLSHFIVNKTCSKNKPSTGLKALKQLNGLSGRLEIELTGDWMVSIGESSEEYLNTKTRLTDLRVSWVQQILDIEKSSDQLSDKDKLQYLNLLENLQPNENLEILCIEGYKGTDFPSWAKVDKLPSSLPNLVVVSIEGCEKCEHLPAFGKLKHLKQLTLRHMANVLYVETNDTPSVDGCERDTSESNSFFQSLEELTLHNFYELQAWRGEAILTHGSPIRHFPRLSKLRIWNCPKLTSMPLFPYVSDVNLQNINQKLLEECAKKLSNHNIVLPKNNCGMENLQIKQCPYLKNFTSVRKGLRDLRSLKQLVIDKCDSLTSLSTEFRYLSSLTRLEISSCKQLDLSHDRIMTGSSWKSLKNLRHLILKEIPKMKTLPEGLKHVQTLKLLWLSSCYNLEELPEWIDGFPVLQYLRIENCLALRRLPDGIQRVKTLIKVEITECPDLMERCRDHTREDWHKIKHARILLHKSWRYGLMSDVGAAQNNSKSNVRTFDNVKYIILPVMHASK